MVGSAVYPVGVLRRVRTPGQGVESFVPRLAVSVALLLFFRHHVTQHLRVDAVMAEIVTYSVRQLEEVPGPRGLLPDQLDRILDSADLADPGDQERLDRAAGLARETLRHGSRVVTATEAT